MPDPEIVKAAQRFKRSLLKQNDAALRQMAHAYGETWRQLQPQLKAVTKLIDQAVAEGKQAVARAPDSGAALSPEQFSINWLARQSRYRDLLYQSEIGILEYTRYAAAMVGYEQDGALNRGRSDAGELLRLSMGPQPPGTSHIGVTWNRVPDEALRNLVGFLSDGSPLAYKFAGLAPAVSDSIKGALEAGFAQGWNPRKIAKAIGRAHKGVLSNTLLTCRTETLRAYRVSSHETYRANNDVCKGWMWLSARNARTCAGCWAMDGTVHSLSETLTDHPAGRCVAVPITRSWEELSGKTVVEPPQTEDPSWRFTKMSVVDQRKVLGATRYQLWKDGKITLRDVAERKRSAVWGDHYQPKSVKSLVLEGKVSAGDIVAARKAL